VRHLFNDFLLIYSGTRNQLSLVGGLHFVAAAFAADFSLTRMCGAAYWLLDVVCAPDYTAAYCQRNRPKTSVKKVLRRKKENFW
jgi:hypothetical protein